MVYLTVTAHPDDEILGFGASTYILTQKGHKVYNCILSGNVEARQYRPEIDKLHLHCNNAQQIVGAESPIMGNFPNIKFNTIPHLELVQYIESIIEEIKPDYIFTHHPSDLNDDHLCTSRACQAAARLFQRRKDLKPIKGLYFMEIPSSTDWAFPTNTSLFQPNAFIEVGMAGVEKKLEALYAYEGVMRPYPHPRSDEAITGLAAMRGGQSGKIYAEAFQAVFQLIE